MDKCGRNHHCLLHLDRSSSSLINTSQAVARGAPASSPDEKGNTVAMNSCVSGVRAHETIWPSVLAHLHHNGRSAVVHVAFDTMC